MIEAKFRIKPVGDIIKSRGLAAGGAAQRSIDENVLMFIEPYMPMRTHHLIDSGSATIVGSGLVVFSAPYAHYVSEGVLYVDPVTRSSWARPNITKVRTNKELTYQYSPQRGARPFERMKAARGKEIVEAAQKILEGGS